MRINVATASAVIYINIFDCLENVFSRWTLLLKIEIQFIDNAACEFNVITYNIYGKLVLVRPL